jgi:hypothetical protein
MAKRSPARHLDRLRPDRSLGPVTSRRVDSSLRFEAAPRWGGMNCPGGRPGACSTTHRWDDMVSTENSRVRQLLEGFVAAL